ncbi:probable receptor-like protein kinase At5g38990 [Rutidosis leptorrhynchoides]|uniref:probable receptor-like protein kinase At5g38990 n=1 Tax=Rutidosis leptorrhynchoides TaxID=125765 RepID=UPI003A98D779
MSFNDIKLATHDFNLANCIGGGGFGLVYKGSLSHENFNGETTIVAKKLDKSQGQGEKQYFNELKILQQFNHENVIGLIGYSDETDEKLLVYEFASNGSLDKHLNNASLTWRNRLEICIDVATGLKFLHEGIKGKGVVIHRDIKAANILLFDNWKAKLGDFGLSLITTMNDEKYFTIDHPCGTTDYVDPIYLKSGILTMESDVYSFGVTLFEILFGRPVYSLPKHERRSLLGFIKNKFENKKENELVFKAISEEIVPTSLITFLNIAYRCLNEDMELRPTSRIILTQLKKALDFQDQKNEEDEKDKEHKEANKDVLERSSYSWKKHKSRRLKSNSHTFHMHP